MPQPHELIEAYESIEQKKQFFIETINGFIKNIDDCIKSHDLNALNSLFKNISSLDRSSQQPLIYSSSFFRLEAIKNALNEENNHQSDLFWDDVHDSSEILYKYNKMIFMLRRLIYEVPQELKDEAVLYLLNISPYMIMSTFTDSTVLVGKPDYIFITLATEHIRCSRYEYASAFLKFVTNQTDEIKGLILKLESIGDLI